MEKLNCKGKLVTKQEKKKEIEVMSKQMKPNTQVNKKKGASGITLIALIITIVLNSSYLAMERMNKIEKI